MNLTARQMLAAMPVRRFADGGDATNVVPSWEAGASAGRARAIANGNEAGWLAQVRASADKYMQNPGTAAEAYDAMIKSGIGIQDLLDSGVSQDTINRALSIPTPEAQKQVNALATTAITSTLAQNPTLASEIASRGAPAIYEQARQFVSNLQKDGLTNEERQYMQQVASQQGWGYSDIRAAGIDPNILFAPPEAAAPVTPEPVTPTPVTPTPVTPTPVTPTPVTPTPDTVTPLPRIILSQDTLTGGVTPDQIRDAVTPTYNQQQLQDIITAAENAQAAAGTVTNPIDTRGSAETGSQSGVTDFLENYVAPTPFQAPTYTAPTVYDPEAFARANAGADLFQPHETALDTAFRESAPRTEVPGMPGMYNYTPAASLRPATGSGWSFTPPSVTSRPRSLLSPTALSYTSPSQQFAQTRATQDQALLAAFRNSGLPQNASNFYSWRNRLRSGEFGAGSAFDPTAFQSAFSSWASTQPPAGGATTQGSAAPLGGVTGYSEIAGGLQPIDLRVMPFRDGGEANAREMLDRLKR